MVALIAAPCAFSLGLARARAVASLAFNGLALPACDAARQGAADKHQGKVFRVVIGCTPRTLLYIMYATAKRRCGQGGPGLGIAPVAVPL